MAQLPNPRKLPNIGDPAIHALDVMGPNTHAFVVKIWRKNGGNAARSDAV